MGGLGEAFYFPAAMSLIASYHGPSTRSRAMSLHQSSVYAGTIAGGALSAYVAERSGWRSSFEVFGALGILLAAVLLFVLRDPAKPDEISVAAAPGPGAILRTTTACAANTGRLPAIADTC